MPSEHAKRAAEEIASRYKGKIRADKIVDVIDAAILAAMGDSGVALGAALYHVTELREAWSTGALHECDGGGGTRSNRNVDVQLAIRKVLG